MKDISLQYSDGSSNGWKITSDSISYHPVTPQMSSSGTYSGGEPASAAIDELGFKKVYEEFESIFKNKDIQIENRIMTSGMLFIDEKGKKNREVIIKPGKEKDQLETILKSLLHK